MHGVAAGMGGHGGLDGLPRAGLLQRHYRAQGQLGQCVAHARLHRLRTNMLLRRLHEQHRHLRAVAAKAPNPATNLAGNEQRAVGGHAGKAAEGLARQRTRLGGGQRVAQHGRQHANGIVLDDELRVARVLCGA